jgi:hypothetical protein
MIAPICVLLNPDSTLKGRMYVSIPSMPKKHMKQTVNKAYVLNCMFECAKHDERMHRK